MTNHPNRNRCAIWINTLDGLSDDPLRRAAQIALAAIDEVISNDALSADTDDTGMVVAYEALTAVLAEKD